MGATWVADTLLMALEQPFVLEGHSIVILRRADMAMPAPAAERVADAGCCHLLRRVM
jgi:hypothetical protein